jgi:poly(hydroxyalkanoate) depolymerase family esterase
MRNRLPVSRPQSSSPTALAARIARLVVGPAIVGASLLASAPASALSMSGPVTGWQQGTEPSYITMYEAVPANLAANAPILVVVHYCGGNASGILGEASGNGGTSTSMASKADSEGFLVVLPQLNGRNCWDVATTPSLTHATGTTSGGDTRAIVDMVKYEIAHRNVNANRVYVTGSSSGAMMTEALLAVYPDVFKGGAEFAGVPAGCWSASYTENNQWSGPCAGGTVTKTAQQWGDAARAMYPGYSGFRPRIQLWHGTADSTINFNNQTEAVKQWTNVMGLSGSGTASSVTIGGHAYTRTQWTNSCNQTVLDEWTETNGPHGTDANMNGQYPLAFFNLDSTPFAATDPQAGCGTTTGTGGAGGSTGSGGAVGTGGTTAKGGAGGSAGGSTGSGGRGGTTGSGGSGGSSTPGAGGSTQGSGGSTQGAGGSTQGAGGSTNPGSGGSSTPGAGGSMVTGVGGNDSSGAAGSGAGGDNTTGAGGSSTPGTGGDNVTGSAGDNGTTGTGNSPQTGGPSMPGCSCEVGGASGAFNALALAGIAFVVFGRRRAKKRSADKR